MNSQCMLSSVTVFALIPTFRTHSHKMGWQGAPPRCPASVLHQMTPRDTRRRTPARRSRSGRRTRASLSVWTWSRRRPLLCPSASMTTLRSSLIRLQSKYFVGITKNSLFLFFISIGKFIAVFRA